MQKRSSFNPKRRIQDHCDPVDLNDLAKNVSYGGNPEHKRDPGDFTLSPPSQPRADKTLCDGTGITTRALAEGLLRQGAKKGLVSVQMRGRYPQNIWAVTENFEPLEAQLENKDQGVYHGYPIPSTDPMREDVLRRWKAS